MRRLLAFGTGAAVIGIALLSIAFWVCYLIVTDLQKTLSSPLGETASATVPLEYATLEAVFLGVMVGIAYGLVTKGLDGIRREEQLERGEVWTEPMFQPTPQATPTSQRGQKPARTVQPAGWVSTGQPSQPSKTAQPAVRPQPVASVQPPEPSAVEKPQPVAQPVEMPVRPTPPPEEVKPTEQFKPAEPPQPPSWVGPGQIKEEAEAPMESERVQPRFGPLLEEPRAETEVKWEGGEPELPKNVEVLPEPERHGVKAAIERESFEAQATPIPPEPEPEPQPEAPIPPPVVPEPVTAESAPTSTARERARARRRERRAKANPPAQEEQQTDSSDQQNQAS